MSTEHQGEITELLKQWGAGDGAALSRLAPVIDQELRRLAKRYLRRETRERTLQTTALINEAYLRLMDVRDLTWQDRTHFFAVAAQMMRRVLVDAARARRSDKRGGGLPHLPIEAALNSGLAPAWLANDDQILILNDALDALGKIDPRKVRVIEMRFFSGLSVEETALALEISAQSVLRDWRLAKSWLARELARGIHDGNA